MLRTWIACVRENKFTEREGKGNEHVVEKGLTDLRCLRSEEVLKVVKRNRMTTRRREDATCEKKP